MLCTQRAIKIMLTIRIILGIWACLAFGETYIFSRRKGFVNQYLTWLNYSCRSIFMFSLMCFSFFSTNTCFFSLFVFCYLHLANINYVSDKTRMMMSSDDEISNIINSTNTLFNMGIHLWNTVIISTLHIWSLHNFSLFGYVLMRALNTS